MTPGKTVKVTIKTKSSAYSKPSVFAKFLLAAFKYVLFVSSGGYLATDLTEEIDFEE